MNWTKAGDLKVQVRRLWERGELLRCLIAGNRNSPWRLTLKGPTSAELTERFEEVRNWIAEIGAMPQIRIEWREVNHRLLGLQRVPQSAWVDGLDNALALIGKHRDAARFAELWALASAQQAALLPWLEKRPLRVLELADPWERLLAVVAWLQRHPRPKVYLRQVDIPGVHSKFIEAYRGVLMEWLDLTLPPESIATNHTGASGFAARYGFLEKPARIRFRVLDPHLHWLPGAQRWDVTLDAESFAALDVPTRRVFITENETNFLAFPPAEVAIIIFGAGYGWDALARARWLERCAIHYWGDIDTHGFAILDQLRGCFDHVESFLMDRVTLMGHQSLWGAEDVQVTHDLRRLTVVEKALFDELRDNRIRERLRLEQEMVGFRWVEAALSTS
jgi:hypothetical protein